MKIGIVSDSHGRVDNVEMALSILGEKGAQTVIHCGDIDDASSVRLFAGWDAHFVFGNCDNDYESLKAAIREIGAKLHDAFGILEIEGYKIGFTHGHLDSPMRHLKQRGDLHYIFYGHTHQPDEFLLGSTRIINPGALHRASPKTFALLDLKTGELERIAL
jgi:putative phosphoesterase